MVNHALLTPPNLSLLSTVDFSQKTGRSIRATAENLEVTNLIVI